MINKAFSSKLTTSIIATALVLQAQAPPAPKAVLSVFGGSWPCQVGLFPALCKGEERTPIYLLITLDGTSGVHSLKVTLESGETLTTSITISPIYHTSDPLSFGGVITSWEMD